jgi:mono/diheme cytochrome c family protein
MRLGHTRPTRSVTVTAIVIGLVLLVAPPAAADHLVIEVATPDAAALGDQVPITVTARSADSGEPLSGATVIFHAVKSFAGVAGEAVLGSAVTNDVGVASFAMTVHVAGVQGIRVEVVGKDEVQDQSIDIPVTIGEQLHESEAGVDLPGLGAGVVVLVVAAAWAIFLTAGRAVLAASRAPISEDDEATLPGKLKISHLATIMMTISVLVAVGLVTILIRSPETHSNLNPEGYDRTPVAYLEAKYAYSGLGFAEGAEDGDKTSGRSLFLASGCAGCHGINAEGTAAAPSPAWASADRLEQIVRDGSVGMPSYGAEELTSMDLDAIYVFLLEAQASPIVQERVAASQPDSLPVTSPGDVPTFADNVGPILTARCGTCHGTAGGWSAADLESVMTTGTNAPVVVPGDPENSLLAQKLLGVQESGALMPPSGTLPDAEIRTIIDWITAGADQ